MKFVREGNVSFTGHLDLMRVFERAIRRASMPVLYSQGYNPRPMMVFALPLGVGIDTVGDYVDISLSKTVDIDSFIEAVNPYLPEGVRLLNGVNIIEPKKSIMSVVTTASYRLEAPGITAAIRSLFEKEQLVVKKHSKGKIIEVDIRSLMLSCDSDPLTSPDSCEILVCGGSSKNLRPDVLLNAAAEYANLPTDISKNCQIMRLGLFGGEYPEQLDIMTLY